MLFVRVLERDSFIQFSVCWGHLLTVPVCVFSSVNQCFYNHTSALAFSIALFSLVLHAVNLPNAAVSEKTLHIISTFSRR